MDKEKLTVFEKLVYERDDIEKQANLIEIWYIREFGNLVQELFELQVECIKLKKQIAFCQARWNEGKAINGEEMEKHIDGTMQKYYDELESLIKVAENDSLLTEDALKEVKRIYFKAAKFIHPDLNPMLFEHEEVQELWNNISNAYKANDIEKLKEYELALASVLEKYGISDESVDVSDIDDKIAAVKAEIQKIKDSKPYTYKQILEDSVQKAEERNELLRKIGECQAYSEFLKEQMTKYTILWVRTE